MTHMHEYVIHPGWKLIIKITFGKPRFLSMLCKVGGLFCLFVCFVALRPKSTAMVIAGRSVHLSTLFPGQA